MANLGGEDGIWRFLIKRIPGGALTGHLFDRAKPGDTVQLDGPYGTAWLRDDCDRDIVLLGGGSGLSPLGLPARGAAAAGMLDRAKLHFFYGGRGQADLFDVDAVLGSDLAGKVTFTAGLSEPEAGWTGASGLLSRHRPRHAGRWVGRGTALLRRSRRNGASGATDGPRGRRRA